MKKQTINKKNANEKPVKKDKRNVIIKSLNEKIKEQEEFILTIQSFNKSLEKQVDELSSELLKINKRLGKEISKRTRAEITLKEKNERLKYQIENSPLAVVEWNSDYYVTQWTKEAEHLFGYSAVEMLGKKIDSLNIIYEPDIPIVVKTMDRLSSGKELTVVSSNRNVTKSGNIIECVWYNSVLVDSENKMSSVQSLILDITEKESARLLAEFEIRNAELEAAISSMATGLILYDTAGRAIRFNKIAESIFPKDIFFKMNVEERYKIVKWEREDGQPFPLDEIPVARALRGETTHNAVIGVKIQDNKLWISASAAPIITADGRMLGVVASFIDITRLKLTEEELKESEQKFSTTLASIGDAVIATDLNSNITFINPVAEELTGWTLGEAINKPVKEIFNIVNEQTGSEVENPETKVLKSGFIEGLANHTILIRKDGTIIPIDDSGAPIKDGEGNTSGVVLVFRDITERKKTEDMLRESEERFRNIFELPKAVMLLIDPGTGEIVDANEAAASYYGWTREQLRNMLIQNINTMNEDEVGHKREEALEAKSNYFIFQHRLANGDNRWVEVYSSKIQIKEKPLLFSIVHDITERKMIEDNLLKSESNIRGILNATRESIYMFDREGKIITANRTAAERLGFNFEDIIGHPFSEFMIKELASSRQRQLDRVFNEGTPLQFEDVRNGLVFIHNFYPVIENEKVIKVVSFSQDITERRHAEEMIEHLATFPRLNPNPIVEIDFTGKVIFTNDAVKTILNELEIEDNGSVFLPDDIFDIIDSIKNANETRTFVREINIKNHLFSMNIYYTKQIKVLRLYATDITQQKIMEIQLRKLSLAVEQSPESVIITNTNGIIEYVNPKFEQVTGYSPEEVRGKNPRILKSGLTPMEVYENLWTNINNGKEWRGELYNRKKNGELFWESVSISPVKNSEGTVTNIVAIKEDITEKKKQIERLFRLNRTLNAMHKSNEAILLSNDETQLMKEVCKVIVEDCGHKMVWIGLAEEDILKTVRPAAFFGYEEGYLNTLNLTWSDTEYGRGPTGTAIRTGKYAICRNMLTDPKFEPWRNEAAKRGYASSIVFPLKIYNKVFGALTIYSGEPDPFSTDEINLLTDLSEDLSYGIDILRLKNAKEHAEIELRKHRDNLEELVKIRSGELKAANEELKSASIYMRTLLEASLDPLVTIDKLGKITDVNRATELATGLSRKELIGNNFSDYFTDPDKAKVGFNKVITEGFVRDFPLTVSNISGKRTDVLYNATIYKNEAGEILGVFAAARDITEQKAAEIELNIYRKHLEELVKTRTEELASANKKLSEEIEKEKKVEILLQESLAKEKELNELKTRFLSTTSHEFRTPLTSILSSMQLVQKYRKKWSDEQLDEHFIKVKYSVQNLTKLLDDILTLSRSESGKLTFSPSTMNLPKFILDIVKEVEHISNEKHEIIFNYSLKGNEYLIDPKLMNFILMNLLTNAIKYSPDGGKVELNISHYGNQIQIIVNDEGIGIPKDENDRLFEPFHRAKNTENIPGTGLGLSIVQLAVQMYNGKIDFQSELGKGTKFIVTLPLENK